MEISWSTSSSVVSTGRARMKIMVEWYWRRLMQWSRAFKPIGHVLQRVGKLFSHWTISLQPPFFVRLNASFVNDVCDSPTDSLINSARQTGSVSPVLALELGGGYKAVPPQVQGTLSATNKFNSRKRLTPSSFPRNLLVLSSPLSTMARSWASRGGPLLLSSSMFLRAIRKPAIKELTSLPTSATRYLPEICGHPLPPQSAGNLFPSCGARYRAHRGTRGWSHHGTGVGIPFGCQIGDKSTQCAFDALKAVSTWGNSAFNMKPRQDTFSNVADRTPRLLRYYVWG